jgi:CRISPR-associated protein Cas6
MTQIIDMVFDASGESLPPDYPFALWEALKRHAPHLPEDGSVGVLPLRTAESGGERLLPKRAKLILRLPQALEQATGAALSGSTLDIAGHPLRLGTGKLREIAPHPTLHAQLVTGLPDELAFLDEMRALLDAMEIKAGLLCGKHATLAGGSLGLSGFSLVVHGLKPGASLRLQHEGLGEGRHFGCGIFLHHKVIPGSE